MGGLRTSWCCILKILWILPLFLLLHQVDCAGTTYSVPNATEIPPTNYDDDDDDKILVGEQCGELPKLPNVEVVGTPGRPPYPVGTTIDIRCEDGYLPKKVYTATCQITSGSVSWIMPSPSCMPVSCPEPEGIENGERKGHVFTFPNSVNYTCFPGYELIGEKRRHCNAEGKWSGRPPKCRAIECPPLQNIANGIVTVNSFKYKGIARYKCNPTFVVRGNEVRECQANKTWSGTEPKCEEARCFVPTNVPGGRVIILVESLPGKGLMIYECDDGQKVTMKCLASGQWDHKFPNCTVDTTTTTSTTTTTTTIPISKATVSTPSNGQQTTSSQKGSTSKTTGIETTTTASSATISLWTTTTPSINGTGFLTVSTVLPLSSYSTDEASQTEPTAGQHEGTMPTRAGSPITSGQRKERAGGSNRAAVNVKPTSSSAKSDCKLDESNFPNGAGHGAAKHGDVRLLKCKSNYELKGSANVSCKNGKWEPGLPKCVKHFPTMLVVIVSVGIALFFVMVCGGVVWYRIKKKRRLQRSTGSNSKARLSDARNYEEMKYLGKDRPEKPIPVTVL